MVIIHCLKCKSDQTNLAGEGILKCLKCGYKWKLEEFDGERSTGVDGRKKAQG